MYVRALFRTLRRSCTPLDYCVRSIHTHTWTRSVCVLLLLLKKNLPMDKSAAGSYYGDCLCVCVIHIVYVYVVCRSLNACFYFLVRIVTEKWSFIVFHWFKCICGKKKNYNCFSMSQSVIKIIQFLRQNSLFTNKCQPIRRPMQYTTGPERERRCMQVWVRQQHGYTGYLAHSHTPEFVQWLSLAWWRIALVCASVDIYGWTEKFGATIALFGEKIIIFFLITVVMWP